ncbi:hypothetical protein CCACVL1_12412 [Corchorus capsularis]|uniref:Uncharacterized protein n=1 Tax=Corchorus capsularis TaxID=210143 RepID=A0A1R3IG20_COCAP|nr:hypothetical protein CCACVL1_12412 [Corchorus capsularis]
MAVKEHRWLKKVEKEHIKEVVKATHFDESEDLGVCNILVEDCTPFID